MARSPDHNPLSPTKENRTDQNRRQAETLRKLAIQLRHMGDRINRRTVQEGLRQEGRVALARLALFVFGRTQVLLRFLWNNRVL
ncbi:PREDICTED: peroxisomal testis-specific protein 1 isoform X2 [Chinchilla lanigera]|nr:PREDICTED: peroxisomal testis-specific protein 1 isoform X2 [Chinchilla lanigera]